MVDKLDNTLPEISKLCVYLQSNYNALFNTPEDDDEGMLNVEFVLLQLLKIAKVNDYSDEVGRRRMLGLLRKVSCRSLFLIEKKSFFPLLQVSSSSCRSRQSTSCLR